MLRTMQLHMYMYDEIVLNLDMVKLGDLSLSLE